MVPTINHMEEMDECTDLQSIVVLFNCSQSLSFLSDGV